MKKVYVHIGFHKTASSSFQETCKKNRDTLASQRIHYPLFDCTENHNFKKLSNHSVPLFSSFTEAPKAYHINVRWKIDDTDALNAGYRNQLEKALRQEKDVILSGEDISALSDEGLNGLTTFLKQHGTEVVPFACVRSPYAYHCSVSQETVKTGGYADFSILRSQKEKILRMKRVFGKIKFIAFQDACRHAQGPVGHMLELCGLDISNIALHEVNEGASNEYIRLQNSLNKFQPAIIDQELNENHVRARPVEGSKFLLTKSELSLLQNDLDAETRFFEKELGPSYIDRNFKVSDTLSLENYVKHFPEIFFGNSFPLPKAVLNKLSDAAVRVEAEDPKLALTLISLVHEAQPSNPLISTKLRDLKRTMDNPEFQHSLAGRLKRIRMKFINKRLKK